MQLFRVVVERKFSNEGSGKREDYYKPESYWKPVRAYIVMAENEEEAAHRLDPLFKDENILLVERQAKSPYAYLLKEV